MKINFKKILNITTKDDLINFLPDISKPIFNNNYLFHYLIFFDKLDALKLGKFEIFKENDEGLNGFLLAAKYNNLEIIRYLVIEYPDYIYNTYNNKNFVDYLKFKNIIELLDLNINWCYLLENKIDKLFYTLNFDELLKLFTVYKPKNHCLHNLVDNIQLSTDQIIKLLNMFKNEINLRDSEDSNIIFNAIHKKDINLIKYLIINNIELDYYTLINTYHPIKVALEIQFYEAYDLIWQKIKHQFNYNLTNMSSENIAHFILKNNYQDKTSLEILTNCSTECWNYLNNNRISPIELLSEYDFNKFNYLLINKKVTQEIINKVKLINIDWYNFIKTLQLCSYEKIVKLEKYAYTHSNIFQAKFKDVCIIVIYILKKYNNLYIPNFKDNKLLNLIDLDNQNLEWPDPLLEYNPIFAWIICYQNSDEYWIHSELNNLINAQRLFKNYDFAFCYLSLKINDGLHANIIIYDFNNLTIERFDPYGDTVNFDRELDDILEEELTWNTGFKYLKPSHFLPISGFQVISDELNPYKQKSGDFGGYCLAWCIWYLEHRIKNQTVKPKKLVDKLIKNIILSDNDFMEYIRNYSNNLYNETHLKYLESINISPKIISNTIYPANI